MSQSLAPTPSSAPSTTPIPVRDLVRPALAALFVLLLGIYLVTMDQGAVSRSGMYLHELMHDGRHLLGFPCH